MNQKTLKVILFDLDGTLLDTAPDLAIALNTLLGLKQRPALPFAAIRPIASHGGKGLIKLGFDLDDTHPDFILLRNELLDIYSQNLCEQTCIFPGMSAVLSQITAKNLRWGIVTNKPGWLTLPLLKQLNLFDKAACVVNGDTLEKRKPDPDPLFHACELLNCAPAESIYIGDAERDIQAAKRAGMPSLLALYGYLSAQDHPQSWGADGMINFPEDILAFLPAD